MSIYIEWLYGDEREELNQLIESAVSASLEYEKVTCPLEISVTIVDNEEIHQINLDQRGKDVPTDVLSFPMINYEEGTVAKGEQALIMSMLLEEPMNPETGERYLGDVVISWDKVLEQSDAYGHSAERELAFLVVHSILHLLGYDHMVGDEEQIMVAKQKEILEGLGLSR